MLAMNLTVLYDGASLDTTLPDTGSFVPNKSSVFSGAPLVGLSEKVFPNSDRRVVEKQGPNRYAVEHTVIDKREKATAPIAQTILPGNLTLTAAWITGGARQI